MIKADGKVFVPGGSFDGWKVRIAKTGLGCAAERVVVSPQGNQFLVLADPFAGPQRTAREVCRSIATVADHRYTVVFLAAVVNSASSQIVMKIGSSSSRTKAISGSLPAVWKSYTLTQKSATTNAQFCISAVNAATGASPVVDRVRVHDLG